MELASQFAVNTALFALVLGITVWVGKERTRTTLPFSLLCLFVAMYCASKFLWRAGEGVFEQLAQVAGVFSLASFYYLLTVYLSAEKKVLDLTVMAAFATSGVYSLLRFIPYIDPFGDFETRKPAALGLTAVIGTGALCVALVAKRAVSQPKGRTRAMMINIIGWILLILIVYVAERLAVPTAPIPTWTVLLAFLLLYFLYQTVVKYRIFGLREIIGRIALIIPSSIVLAVIFGLLIYIVGVSPLRFSFQTIMAAFLLLLLYDPLLTKMEAGTLRWVFKGGMKQRQKMGGLARNLAARISVQQVLEFLTKAVKKELGFVGSKVYFYKNEKFTCAGGTVTVPQIIKSDTLARLLLETNEAVYINSLRIKALDLYPGPERDDILKTVQALEAIPSSVILPLRHQESLIGFWSVNTAGGPDLQGETAEVLLSLADQAALKIDNARMYQDLKIKDRLATVGEMAAGLAHEIRNPLGSMKGAAEYLRDEPIPAGSSEFVQIIIDEAVRLNGVLSRFLDFARPFKLDIQETDVSNVVENAASTIKVNEAVNNIEILTKGTGNPVTCKLDPELIKQVIINLAINSIQAMPNGGRLTIEVIDAKPVIRIRITDTGHGIKAEDMERLFEPFFSTKKGGAGLGLAISRRICQAHGGDMLVDSVPGKGAGFTINIPITGKDTSGRTDEQDK